eukprot:GHVO01023854.1.p1 GENE.GHVO01023854.1~~GHVO01023854.1.p1  ORF type:complete len:167 (+),score=29.61 GHVO01023854.1:25-501(+)
MWNLGYRRHVWISVSNDLAQDAMRDLRDIGAGHIPVIDLGGIRLCNLDSATGMREAQQRVRRYGWEWNGEGVIFCTYTLLARNLTRENETAIKGDVSAGYADVTGAVALPKPAHAQPACVTDTDPTPPEEFVNVRVTSGAGGDAHVPSIILCMHMSQI